MLSDHTSSPTALRVSGIPRAQAVASLAPGFLREHNPIVRHTVLRRRQTLEEAVSWKRSA